MFSKSLCITDVRLEEQHGHNWSSSWSSFDVLVGNLGSTSRLHIGLRTVGKNLCTNALTSPHLSKYQHTMIYSDCSLICSRDMLPTRKKNKTRQDKKIRSPKLLTTRSKELQEEEQLWPCCSLSLTKCNALWLWEHILTLLWLGINLSLPCPLLKNKLWYI